jgi:uncharacterized protein
VRSQQRIILLDLLRGAALAAILFMNVQSFSMPDAAYANPTAFGDLSGLNLVSWFSIELLLAGKGMGLFSLLFGAGVALLSERGFSFHFRRMAWLLVFGLLHFYLLWWGDILHIYAICGLLIYPLHRLCGRALLGLAVALLGLAATIEVDLIGCWFDPVQAQAFFVSAWQPSPGFIAAELAQFQAATWSELLQIRHEYFLTLYVDGGLPLAGSLVMPLAYMVLGMALLKLGWLAGRRSVAAYRTLAAIGLVVGGALQLVPMIINLQRGFPVDFNLLVAPLLQFAGVVAMVVGDGGLVALIALSGPDRAGLRRLCALGRTAFSNYVLQSALCGLLFYSYGLGLFGRVSRFEQLLVASAIVLLQLWLASVVLRHWRHGPLEWLWRCLVGWQWHPLVRRGES